jgi:hypothetical protein
MLLGSIYVSAFNTRTKASIVQQTMVSNYLTVFTSHNFALLITAYYNRSIRVSSSAMFGNSTSLLNDM